jgi:hypothetical protein
LLCGHHTPEELNSPANFSSTWPAKDLLRYALAVSGQWPRVRTPRPPGSEALDLPLHVQFKSDNGQWIDADVAGYERLRVRPYDPSRDVLTLHKQMTQPLLVMFSELHSDKTLDTDDIEAFCTIFASCVRAGQMIRFDKAFRAGSKVTEKQFHDAFEEYLRGGSTLTGQLTRRDEIAGGLDDLMYDGIVVELKVEKTTPREVKDCARYIGQPTQYGVGRGSRLSILVVLDQTKKAAPPSVLENYMGWMYPSQHGLHDQRFPSRVGVLVIKANWPVPSAWSRRKITVRSPKSEPRSIASEASRGARLIRPVRVAEVYHAAFDRRRTTEGRVRT